MKKLKSLKFQLLVFSLFGCALGQYGAFRGFPTQNAYRSTPRPTYQQPTIQPQYTSQYKYVFIYILYILIYTIKIIKYYSSNSIRTIVL